MSSLPTQLCLNSEPDGRFYVYTLSDDESVFYVGKGSGKRAFEHVTRAFSKNYSKKNQYKYNKIRTLVNSGKSIVPSILFTSNNEDAVFEAEKSLIKYFGKDNLCNHTDGGEGRSGRSHTVSEEAKQKIRNAQLGHKMPEVTRLAIANSKGATGHTVTDEQRQILSERMKSNKIWVGRKHSEEAKQKMRLGHARRRLSV